MNIRWVVVVVVVVVLVKCAVSQEAYPLGISAVFFISFGCRSSVCSRDTRDTQHRTSAFGDQYPTLTSDRGSYSIIRATMQMTYTYGLFLITPAGSIHYV